MWQWFFEIKVNEIVSFDTTNHSRDVTLDCYSASLVLTLSLLESCFIYMCMPLAPTTYVLGLRRAIFACFFLLLTSFFKTSIKQAHSNKLVNDVLRSSLNYIC